MTLNKKIALLFAAALAVSATAHPARAQGTRAPIVVKSKPAAEPKPVRVRFEVLHMMINAIQVRSLENERELHTFIYSDQIRDQMQAMFNNGGYQYGDKVVVYFMPGSDVALKIKGRPSKPI